MSEKTNYDDIADTYIPHVQSERSWNNLYERPYMLSLLGDLKGSSVVDAGCGSGFYTGHALQHGAQVIATDASAKMLAYVEKEYASDALTIVKADLKDGLPFVDIESQDLVICSLALHYVNETDVLINDFCRVLKPGGKVVISTHHPFADHLLLNKKSYYDNYLVEDHWSDGITVYYYTKSLTQLLTPVLESGLILEKLDEPLPTEYCRKIDPGAYRKLRTQPAFLFLTLRKPWESCSDNVVEGALYDR